MNYYERVVSIRKSEYIVNDDDILFLEQKYDVRLPEEYKKFLLKYNGGETNKVSYTNKKCEKIEGFECGFWDIERFFEINSENEYWELSNRVKGLLMDLEFSDKPNWKLWAIALSTSRLFAISLNDDENYGAVYFIDTMVIEEFLSYTKVEHSFKSFIENLESDKEVDSPEVILKKIEEKYFYDKEKLKILLEKKKNSIKENLEIVYTPLQL